MASITRCGDCKPVVNDNVTVNDSISCVPMLNDRGPEKNFARKYNNNNDVLLMEIQFKL